MHKGYLTTAALIGALSVILGAFGAHSLKPLVSEQALNIYETAVRYQFYHVFALALTGILYERYRSKLIRTAGSLFIMGMVFFCGSLYLLTYASATGNSVFNWAGPVTPLGGLCLLAGWIMLALGIRKQIV